MLCGENFEFEVVGRLFGMHLSEVVECEKT